MKKLHIYISVLSAMLALAACHKPEYKIPDEGSVTIGFTSFTGKFLDDDRDENLFKSETDEVNHIITIVFPYTYPANSTQNLVEEDLKKVKVTANLDPGCSIEPGILFMDLTKDNPITVVNQRGDRQEWTVRGEIRKSAECSVTSYKLAIDGTSGIIIDSKGTISIPAFDPLVPQKAEIELSFGASITSSINPATDDCDYDAGFKFTVTAQDGTTSREYTVSTTIPDKLSSGMRAGSAKILWTVKLKETYKLENPLMMNSMAVLKDYIVLNTRNEDLLVVSRKDGSKVGTITLPFLSDEAHPNFKITSDDNDNILITSLSAGVGTLKVYRIKGIHGTPELYISCPTGYYKALDKNGNEYDALNQLGRSISVSGSLDGDAVITIPITNGQNIYKFRRWTVGDGVLDTEFEDVEMVDEAITGAWNYACDVIGSDPSNPKADYFVASYAMISPGDGTNNRAGLWMEGSTNRIRCHSPYRSVNWVSSSADYQEFNGGRFVVMNSANGFTWGSDDIVYMYDLSESTLENIAWSCEPAIYGAYKTIGEANGSQTGDCQFGGVSEDGYFMYLYFFFTGGQMVAVQFDCLDI